jgi:hypothetical protein
VNRLSVVTEGFRGTGTRLSIASRGWRYIESVITFVPSYFFVDPDQSLSSSSSRTQKAVASSRVTKVYQ